MRALRTLAGQGNGEELGIPSKEIEIKNAPAQPAPNLFGPIDRFCRQGLIFCVFCIHNRL